jgi:hypothetical protein
MLPFACEIATVARLRRSLTDDVQAVLQQLALLGAHTGVAGTSEIPHESSDVAGMSAMTVNN